MFTTRIEPLNNGTGQQFVILDEAKPLTFADVLSLWRENVTFRSYFISLLADAPFEAYRWETPCVTSATFGRDFEFVLLKSRSLARPVNPAAFAAHFDSESEIVTFTNLGGDAVLVVPCPVGDTAIYGHLASFIRHAPQSQLHQLWIAVADAMYPRICDRPVWLSTAGMGVSWLHVRLDDRPKYYGYAPFRQTA